MNIIRNPQNPILIIKAPTLPLEFWIPGSYTPAKVVVPCDLKTKKYYLG